MWRLGELKFVPEDPDPVDVFALLDDECARTILRATSRQAMTAPELVEACEASRATVYRRIADLTDRSLLTETTQYDEEGNHRGLFVASLRRLSIELQDGEFTFAIEEDPADRMTDFWGDL